MAQKITISQLYSCARIMPPGYNPCATNHTGSRQFWKTYTCCLMSKELNVKCYCSLIQLSMVTTPTPSSPLAHTSPQWRRHQMEPFLCVTGPLSQRPVTHSFGVFLFVPEETAEQTIETSVIWDAIALIMTLLQYSCCLGVLQTGLCVQRPTFSLYLLNAPLPMMPSRAAWRLYYLMWHIQQSTDPYFVRVDCLRLVFSTYKRFWTKVLLIILKSTLYGCNRIINVMLKSKSSQMGGIRSHDVYLSQGNCKHQGDLKWSTRKIQDF